MRSRSQNLNAGREVCQNVKVFHKLQGETVGFRLTLLLADGCQCQAELAKHWDNKVDDVKPTKSQTYCVTL